MEERVQLIQSIGEEVIGSENLERLLTHKEHVVAYDGFEPSGRMHIAQGLLRAHNVNKFIKAGVHFKFWVADWFALMNLKMGGSLEKIQTAGKLMIETWKACGMNMDSQMVEFIWSSEEINRRSDEYWKLVLDIGTKFNLPRIKRCTQIMGRKEDDAMYHKLIKLNNDIDTLFLLNTEEKPRCGFSPAYQEQEEEITSLKRSIKDAMGELLDRNTDKEELAASQIFYPVMQCADIFFLGVDICSLGIDQKKVNMLAIEYCDKIKRKNKPIIVSHHMIMGLDGSDKMSKSNPDNTIFMDDSEAEVKRKIKKAFCEPGNIAKNPILDWIKWLILPITESFTIIDKAYVDFNELETDYANLKIHPSELKSRLIVVINELLQPVREYFIENKEAAELLEKVRKYR
jgi:tyrosyl-tRNA synthetase